ncbi:hypothetical protein SAMN05216337_1007159 [Bradyrhizobium brasilense]|uniref:Uncharacterized protein n=1 Tax=Bradyrhizobium brasilense TaxID=1419277 RepID=A0A1G6RYQ1_9BRAD|nr:hypothetical protein SAMN05216337_1007159 [Bradyrhizobium brasilense]
MNRLTLSYTWKQKQIPVCCAGPDAVSGCGAIKLRRRA